MRYWVVLTDATQSALLPKQQNLPPSAVYSANHASVVPAPEAPLRLQCANGDQDETTRDGAKRGGSGIRRENRHQSEHTRGFLRKRPGSFDQRLIYTNTRPRATILDYGGGGTAAVWDRRRQRALTQVPRRVFVANARAPSLAREVGAAANNCFQCKKRAC